jgi:hypothetical protein
MKNKKIKRENIDRRRQTAQTFLSFLFSPFFILLDFLLGKVSPKDKKIRFKVSFVPRHSHESRESDAGQTSLNFASQNFRGQTMLSLIFLIGGVIITIGVMLSILGFSFITSITGYRSAILAEAAADSGANDGILQVVRNANFSNTSGYTLPFTNVSDNVTVTQGTPSANEATVISLAQIGTIKQKIQVILSIDPTSKKVDVISYQKISL